jgi:hypothetical protein
VEDDKVHVLDSDDPRGKPKALNPARRRLLAAATVSGLLGVVVIIVLTQSSPIDPSPGPAETSSTATTSLPTTTVWRGVTYPATVLQTEVRSFCEQGAAMGPDMQLKNIEEWTASLGTAIFGFGGSVVDHISVEAAHARNAKDLRLAAVLESVSEDLTNALSEMGNAEGASDVGRIDSWTRQMFRVERLCALAEGTISTLVSLGEE